MGTITLNKREYSELMRIKDIIERILKSGKEKKPKKIDKFLEAFGIFKDNFREDSLSYVSKLRKEWRE